MQQDITKLCADSLRAFTNDKFGEKLKASHAHELVAALLGYKSRAALLADTELPLANLHKSEFFIFDPTPCNTGFVRQRIIDFGYGSFTEFQLADCFYATLRAEKWFADKLHLNFRELTNHIAEQRQDQKMAMWRMDPPMKWDIREDMYWADDGEPLMTADVGYFTDAGDRLRDSKYTIRLKRVSANLGYKLDDIQETRYSGNFRKMDFPEDIFAAQ